jgi:hypothetical protein
MIGLIARMMMAVAGIITGWFVVRDHPNFGLIQVSVGILLVTLVVAVAVFWPSIMSWLRNRREREDRRGGSGSRSTDRD